LKKQTQFCLFEFTRGSHESVQKRSKGAQKCTKFYKNLQKPSKTMHKKTRNSVHLRFHLKKQSQFSNSIWFVSNRVHSWFRLKNKANFAIGPDMPLGLGWSRFGFAAIWGFFA